MLPVLQRKGSCKPCRERKVQCDEKKPRCSECISTNKICGGYDLGNIFINMNSTEPPPVWSRSRNAQKYLAIDMTSQPTTSKPLEAPRKFDPTNTHEITELFLDFYYRRIGPNKSSSEALQPGSECGGWRALLPLWIGQSPILDTAIRAMATCFVGTQYQDEYLVDQGRNAYLDALRMFQKALSEPDFAYRKDLLATTLVMGSTESFLSKGGGENQFRHIEGGNKLMQSMMESHNTKDIEVEELHIYVLNQALFESLSQRRSNRFSSSSYRPFVRHIYSANPTYRNNLFHQWCELILPLPSILEATDRISTGTTSSIPIDANAVLGILNDLTVLEQTLVSWQETFKAKTPGPSTFPTAQINADSVPFPLQFTDMDACHLHCLHWTSQLLILDARNALISHLPHNMVPGTSSLDLPARIEEYASLICRSVQFCTQNTSFAATGNIFLPLHQVTTYYSRQGDQNRKNWCVRAFTRMAKEHKIGFASEQLL